MKVIVIKNRMIQFDGKSGSEVAQAADLLTRINEVLQREFPDEQPQIFESDLDVSDLESEDKGEDE